jgi:hypothetical protein
MAVLHTDLSIDTTPHPAPPTAGMTGRGYLTASVRHLRDLLGASHRELGPDRESESWVLHTPAGVALLWAGTSDRDSAGEQEVPRRWLILAGTDDVLPWVYKAVHGSVEAFPSAALPHFTEATLHGFGNAYLGYLYLRMIAEDGRRGLDRAAPEYLTHLRRPRQLNTMLLRLSDVLHGYEWAHASMAERAEWCGMQRPRPGSGLRDWKARNRWLYPSGRAPFGGYPDLPGGLRALADGARDDRGWLLEIAPEMDLVLHDEHEQTLRALADIPIPGLDALQFARG